MTLFHGSVILATLLCALVAGFVFAFAVVAMPGIGTLGDREFLRAFQVIDRVIQDRNPVFIAVWAGSMVATVVALAVGWNQVAGMERLLLVGAAAVFLLGVQAPTLTVNVPLNNQLQTLDLQTADESTVAQAREAFEALWNRWNVIRTVFAVFSTVLWVILLLRL